MKKLTMQAEPIRLPGWLATLLTVLVIPVTAAALTGMSVPAAFAAALVTLTPLIVANEISRRHVDSPATVEAKVEEALYTAIPRGKRPSKGVTPGRSARSPRS